MSGINVQYSIKTGEKQYKVVDDLRDATGISLFRNNATIKSFNKAVAEMKQKFEGTHFALLSQSDDYASFAKSRQLKTIDVLRKDVEAFRSGEPANHDPVLEFEADDDLPF